MPSPMPTLAAPLSPADSEVGGMGLLKGATVAAVFAVATDEVRVAVVVEGCGELVDSRGVAERRSVVEVGD